MDQAWLDFLPLWGAFFIVVGFLAVSLEAGYRFGVWRHHRTRDEKEQPVGAMVGSILGLLALVLGFTFSLAANRFDARRQIVLEESNAIGTAYLRARLLPDPERQATLDLIREYVDVRLRAVERSHTQEAIRESEQIHERLWQLVTPVAERQGNSIIVGVYVQSLNQVIDLHAKRILVGLRSRIPITLWGCLFALVMLGTIAVGYQAGLAATRRSPAMVGLIVAFAIVLSLILDLDRGQGGFIRVSQQAMIDLRNTLDSSEGDATADATRDAGESKNSH